MDPNSGGESKLRGQRGAEARGMKESDDDANTISFSPLSFLLDIKTSVLKIPCIYESSWNTHHTCQPETSAKSDLFVSSVL